MTVPAAPNRPTDPERPDQPDAKSRVRGGRIGAALLWVVLPGLTLLVVAAYIAAATIGHVNPPVVPVTGLSMRPTLQAGDLVFLKGVDPKTLRKGDIIALDVPADARKEYDLPAQIVHRILKVGHDPEGLVFTTKGDANGGPDVFKTHANDVVGEMRFHVTGLGYPLLFFRSRQGEIFLAAAALLTILYLALGLFEERRIAVEATAVTMQAVLEETQVLKETLTRAGAPAPSAVAVPPAVRSGAAASPPELAELIVRVSQANSRSEETSQAVRTLVGAIGEYGEHLRSHTAVMQNLAATTAELHQATLELRRLVAGRGQAPSLGLVSALAAAPARPASVSDAAAVAAERGRRTTDELERALARLRSPAAAE